MKTRLLSLFLALLLCVLPLVACDDGNGSGNTGTPPASGDPEHTHTPGAEATCTIDQVCTVCGDILTPKKGHTPGADATCEDDQTCTVCGDILTPKKGHTPGADATCTIDQVCTVCGDILTPKKDHTPGADATCKADQTCTVCGDILTPKKDHTPGADATCKTDQTCTECGDVLTPKKEHIPGADATCKADQTCTVCGDVLTPKLEHIPGADATCKADQVCTVCGDILTPKKDHTYATTRSFDDTHHWYAATCGCDVKKAVSAHSFSNTLTNNGTHHWYASTCGCNVKKNYAPHTPGVSASCNTDQTCTACRRVLVGKLGHAPVQHAGKTPTCTELGWDPYETCSRCDYSTYAPRYGHTYEEGGNTCTICNTTLIFTAADLKNMKRTGKYVLMNDIDLGGYEWTPIGQSSSTAFLGSLDGNGYAITNFFLSGVSDVSYIGFFGYNTGTIKNLTLKDIDLNFSTYIGTVYVGSLVGYNNGTVENCHATGKISLNSYVSSGLASKQQCLYFGGLIGYHAKNVDIKNCHSTLDITVKHTIRSQSSLSSNQRTQNQNTYVGGLVGYSSYGITDCFATGNLSYSFKTEQRFTNNGMYIGGLVGSVSGANGSITGCYTTGNVTGTATITESLTESHLYVGGLAGEASNITHSHATGDVLADCPYPSQYNGLPTRERATVGGLCALLSDYGNISYCYATGSATARQEFTTSAVSYPMESFAGGLCGTAGDNSLITDCYATGDVSSTYLSGGLVASAYRVSNCYATGNVSAISRTEYGAPKAGGLVASVSSWGGLTSCYATGNVTVISYRAIYISEVLGGGLCGYNLSASRVDNCYTYNGQTFSITKISTTSNQPINTVGSPTAMATLTSVAFQRDALGWSSDVWQMTAGAHPTLK